LAGVSTRPAANTVALFGVERYVTQIVMAPPGRIGRWLRARCAVVPPPELYGVVGTGVLCDVSTMCAVVPPPELYGVVGTGLLCDVSTLCALVPPPELYGVVGTGLLCDVSTLCALVLLLNHMGHRFVGVWREWSLLTASRRQQDEFVCSGRVPCCPRSRNRSAGSDAPMAARCGRSLRRSRPPPAEHAAQNQPAKPSAPRLNCPPARACCRSAADGCTARRT
jgi:hypothetical protein